MSARTFYMARAVRVALMAAMVFALVTHSRAQSVSPHIGYVFPAGGRQGATLQVKLGGQALDGVTNVFVTGGGVRARVVEHVKPLSQKQFNDLRERAQELMKAPKTAAALKELADIRKRLLTFKRNANPAIADKVTIEVTIVSNAPAGPRELRLGAALGLSNPLMFCIGDLPEFTLTAPEVEDSGAKVRKPKRGTDQESATPARQTFVSLPCTVNGQILQGGLERFRFTAHKGQHIVAVVSARELIPYLPDAVPGWFQATLGLYDSRGKELAYDDDFRFHPDPVLHFEIPADGTYMLEIKDAIYRGREDFIYRVSIGELPFITSVYPLGGKVGAETTLELKGWNLPQQSIVHLSGSAPGTEWITVTNAGRVSNRVPFAVDDLFERTEQEPNNKSAEAQHITLPVVVNGRIDKPGDVDVFKFTALAGEQIVAEVVARRLDSPLDSVLRIGDDTGKLLVSNDDHEDKGTGLNTHHADSLIAFTVTNTGTYFVYVADIQRKGGSDFAYRLRISQPRPDFALRLVPSSITLRGPGAVPVTIYALRKDGFTNAIDLKVSDTPGFVLGGARIPAGQDSVRVTVNALGNHPEPTPLHVQGRAVVDGRELVRPAIPAEDMMQAFAYRHLVPAEECLVDVIGRGRRNNVAAGAGFPLVRIPAGGSTTIHVPAPALALNDRIHLELSEPPDGISMPAITPERGGVKLTFTNDIAKAKAGTCGNLIVNAYMERGGDKANPKKSRAGRALVGTLPAIPFEVVSR